MPENHWRAEVYHRGTNILTVEHACYSGKSPLTNDDEAAIRTAGENLLGFVGSPRWALIENAPRVENQPLLLGCLKDGQWLASSGYWTDHNGGGWVRWMPWQPTHWMPMPTPPNK